MSGLDVPQMLHNMCHQVLSNADVKAICKSRGFSAQEAASRALFENFFLSDIGIEPAMGLLTREEVVLLHMLKWLDEAVAIAVFARIYGAETSSRYYYTFTKRYRDVFKKVKTSLIRRGVLLLAEGDAWIGDTKMERWRFRFPRQFEPSLPPIVRHLKVLQADATARPDARRKKLLEVVRGKQPSLAHAGPQYDLKLEKGELRMGKDLFQVARLEGWQRACWEAQVPLPKKARGEPPHSVSPVQAVIHVLEQLQEDEWVRPGHLSVPLQVFCGASLSGDQVCTAGWEWGCLARCQVDGLTYYRLQRSTVGQGMDPRHYLEIADEQSLVVDLETVPYESLEHLAQICDVRATDSSQGHSRREGAHSLAASPNLIKMGNAPPSTWGLPLTRWLQENVPAFRQALETVQRRWGKQILHENLAIARVGDLSLQVQLERAFSGSQDVIFLPHGYIAFSQQMLDPMSEMVTKLGHVIKTVENG